MTDETRFCWCGTTYQPDGLCAQGHPRADAERQQRDRCERHALAAELDGRRAHLPAAAVPGIDDLSVADLDPSFEAIREPEPVGVAQRVEILDHVGRRIVVVRESHLEDGLVHSRDRFRRDPRE